MRHSESEGKDTITSEHSQATRDSNDSDSNLARMSTKDLKEELVIRATKRVPFMKEAKAQNATTQSMVDATARPKSKGPPGPPAAGTRRPSRGS